MVTVITSAGAVAQRAAHDLQIPGRVRQAAPVDALPDPGQVVLPGVGHLPHVEDVGAFRIRVAAFLDQLA